MLLEYCAVLDYKQIITEIDTESKINKDKLEAEFEAKVRKIESNNQELRNETEAAIEQSNLIELER